MIPYILLGFQQALYVYLPAIKNPNRSGEMSKFLLKGYGMTPVWWEYNSNYLDFFDFVGNAFQLGFVPWWCLVLLQVPFGYSEAVWQCIEEPHFCTVFV